MTFTSNLFLIGLLPLFLVTYILAAEKRKITLKMVLLAFMNTLFYVFGGVKAFVFFAFFIVLTFCLTRLIYTFRKKGLFIISCILLALPLLFVKYSTLLFEVCLGDTADTYSVIMPLGISFFTFEAISLIADTYTEKIDRKIPFFEVFLYLSFFVTITSGPIIRLEDFESKKCVDYYRYFERICIGLIKKLLIADKIAPLVDLYFNGVAMGHSYSVMGLWIGSIAYTLQLYFDFSGYSDIAIGIGGLCGFDIPENFNSPYQARSIQDFWRRWHITLSRWFRDYIYIPLGGNRCSVPRHIFNMLVVWIITGAWHGSDLSFIVWGIGYFILLISEKYIPKLGKIENHWYGHLYALFFINLLWVPFRASNLQTAGRYIAGMFGLNKWVNGSTAAIGTIEGDTLRFLPVLIIAVIMCMPVVKWVEAKTLAKSTNAVKGIMIIVLMFLAVCAVVNSSYTPYIYGGF